VATSLLGSGLALDLACCCICASFSSRALTFSCACEERMHTVTMRGVLLVQTLGKITHIHVHRRTRSTYLQHHKHGRTCSSMSACDFAFASALAKAAACASDASCVDENDRPASRARISASSCWTNNKTSNQPHTINRSAVTSFKVQSWQKQRSHIGHASRYIRSFSKQKSL